MLVISTAVGVVCVIVCIKHKHKGTVSAYVFVLHEILFHYDIEQII